MKKALSMFIVILLILSAFPVGVFASEEEVPNVTDETFTTQEEFTQTEEIPELPEENTEEKNPDIIAAEEFIKMVNAIGDVSIYDEKAIVDAIKVYNSLSDLAKELAADAKARLDEKATVLEYLKAEEEKRLEREVRLIDVTEAIEKSYAVTKEEGHIVLEEAIKDLEEKYSLLSDEEKLLINDRLLLEGKSDYETILTELYSTLSEYRKEYDEEAILPLKEKLVAVENITSEEGTEVLENAINNIKESYGLLTQPQKELIDKAIGGYEEKIRDLENRLEAWKNSSDISIVISMLTEISLIEKITPDNAELINDTKRALDMIPDKSGIPSDLLENFSLAVPALEKAINDKNAAQETIVLIDKIGEVTLSSEEAINSARNAYETLTEDQKYYVTNINTLTSSEEYLASLKDAKIKADELIILIDNIGEVSLEKEEEIVNARNIYDSLIDAGKEFVTNIDKLISAENVVNDIKTAGEVTSAIENIGEVSLEKLSLIEGIRESYDALTESQKALVPNLSVLESAEDILKDHIAANKVTKLINKLPDKATFTKDASIYSAKEAYDKLTQTQKDLVTNGEKIISLYKNLLSMEEKLEDYLSEYGSQSLYIDDTTGYVTVSCDIHDFLTDKDKDLIAKGKMVIYTVTVVSEEFTYEEVNTSILPIEMDEVPFSPFYYVYISRAVADMSDGKIIYDDSDVTDVESIPGEMIIEITVTEDMMPQVSEITRIFTGLISPAGNFSDFTRIMDTDMNMNTITFAANGSVNIIPSFIDIMNPVTGDNGTVYIIFGVFALLLAGILVMKKRRK